MTKIIKLQDNDGKKYYQPLPEDAHHFILLVLSGSDKLHCFTENDEQLSIIETKNIKNSEIDGAYLFSNIEELRIFLDKREEK